MSDSTRRAARTAWQVLIAAIAIVGVLVALSGDIAALWPRAAAVIASIAAVTGIVARLMTALEDRFPQLAWLRDDNDLYRLSDSTRRALRTGYQTIVGAAAFIVLVAPWLLPTVQQTAPAAVGFLTVLVAVAGLVSKAANLLQTRVGSLPILTAVVNGPVSPAPATGRHEAGG